MLDFLTAKLPSIDTTLEYRATWAILNPMNDLALEVYRAGLTHREQSVRRQTVILLTRATVTLPDGEVSRLVEMAVDERLFAPVMTVLKRQKRDEGVGIALHQLQNPDSSRAMKVAASDYVGSRAPVRALPVLRNLLGSEDFMIRAASLRALVVMGESSKPLLRQLAEDKNPRSRCQAVEWMARSGAELHELHPWLLDGDRRVRATATRWARRRGETVATLQRILGAKADDSWIRGALGEEPTAQ